MERRRICWSSASWSKAGRKRGPFETQVLRLDLALGDCQVAEVEQGQLEGLLGSDDLHGLPPNDREGGAQGFVTADDLVQALLEGGQVEGA
jgi:hypothetical protein